MAERKRDLSFEKLAEVTGQEISMLNAGSRGAMNKALALIRESMPDLADAELALVIEAKAKTYRKVMDGAILTPTALAAHWAGLDGMLEAQSAPVTYVSYDRMICTTCDGTKSILVGYTRPTHSSWMLETMAKTKAMGRRVRQIAPWIADPSLYEEERHGHEAWAPCPDCSSQAALDEAQKYRSNFDRRYNSSPRLPVPGQVADMLSAMSSGIVQSFDTPPNTEES